MLMLLSKIQGLEAAIDQFSELLNGRGAIRKQVTSGLFIFGDLDRAIAKKYWSLAASTREWF